MRWRQPSQGSYLVWACVLLWRRPCKGLFKICSRQTLQNIVELHQNVLRKILKKTKTKKKSIKAVIIQYTCIHLKINYGIWSWRYRWFVNVTWLFILTKICREEWLKFISITLIFLQFLEWIWKSLQHSNSINRINAKHWISGNKRFFDHCVTSCKIVWQFQVTIHITLVIFNTCFCSFFGGNRQPQETILKITDL